MTQSIKIRKIHQDIQTWYDFESETETAMKVVEKMVEIIKRKHNSAPSCYKIVKDKFEPESKTEDVKEVGEFKDKLQTIKTRKQLVLGENAKDPNVKERYLDAIKKVPDELQISTDEKSWKKCTVNHLSNVEGKKPTDKTLKQFRERIMKDEQEECKVDGVWYKCVKIRTNTNETTVVSWVGETEEERPPDPSRAGERMDQYEESDVDASDIRFCNGNDEKEEWYTMPDQDKNRFRLKLECITRFKVRDMKEELKLKVRQAMLKRARKNLLIARGNIEDYKRHLNTRGWKTNGSKTKIKSRLKATQDDIDKLCKDIIAEQKSTVFSRNTKENVAKTYLDKFRDILEKIDKNLAYGKT